MSTVEGNSEWMQKYHENNAFLATEIGKLFAQFEHAHAIAIQVDRNENASDASLRKAWETLNNARSEFVAALKALQAKAEGAP